MNKWIKILLSLSIFLLLFLGFFHPTNELSLDLGQHLLRGKIMFESHQIITTNLFSYTYPDFSYVSNGWFVEVIFYLINSIFGLNGLIILTAIIVVGSFSLLYLNVVKRSSIILISFISLLYVLMLFERAYIRPEVFSYLFLSIFIVLLYRFREKYSSWIFLLIPLQLLWVNMHIYFIVGIFVTGLFLLEGLIQLKKNSGREYVRILLLIFISQILVSCVNPYGIDGLLFPLNLSQNYGFAVQENYNLFTVENLNAGKIIYSFLFFKIASVILIVSLLSTVSKSRLIDWFIAISFIIAPVVAVRNLPLFVIATFIPFAYTLTTVIKKYISIDEQGSINKVKIVKSILVLIFVISIFWIGKILSDSQGIGFGSDKRGEAAVNFFVSNNIKGPIFNDYDFGSYLAYRLYPKELVFVDGRPEAYPVHFFQQVYLPMQVNKTVFKTIDEKYHFNSIFFSITGQSQGTKVFINTLLADNKWKLVYLDHYAIIFVKNSVNNQEIIQKYGIVEDKYKISEDLSIKDLDNLGYFFDEISWKSKALEAYKKIYERDETNCIALHNILFLLGPSHLSFPVYATKYQMICNK